MSEGADEAASTASDTESLECEPRVQRRRLSLVWDVGSNPQPASQSGEPVPDSHEDTLGRVRHVVQEERRANIQQRQVLVAEEFIRSVISRVGPVRRSQDQIPITPSSTVVCVERSIDVGSCRGRSRLWSVEMVEKQG